MHWVYLSIAICAEVAGTSALKASDGFMRFVALVLVVISYGLAFVMLSHALPFLIWLRPTRFGQGRALLQSRWLGCGSTGKNLTSRASLGLAL